MRHPHRRSSLLAVLLTAPLGLAAPAEGKAISGVCPDGSIFIVQDRNRIPCRAAKVVAPDEVPPLRPEYLPRPYSWQVYREGANPNNPYNLIDAARRVRELKAPPNQVGAGGLASGGAPTAEQTPSVGAAGPQSFAARARAPRAPRLALSHDEIRNLFLIVELSQQRAPARFLKEDAAGVAALEVSLAWSEAFEARWRADAPAPGGPVLLFSALAHRPGRFHPNLTFVQGHETFRPRAEDPAQMGILEGAPGELPAEGVVLGYVVLPARMDLARDLDVYWNDRRIGTVLRP